MLKRRVRLWFYYFACLVFTSVCLSYCTYEADTEISLDGEIPPNFKLTGSGHQIYFVVSEIPPENQVRAADRDSDRNTRIWKILPKQGTSDIAWNWPTVTYGKVPDGFRQEIPEEGEPPRLIEGKVYVAGGPAYGANGGEVWFTLRDGKSVIVPKPGGY